MARSTNKFTIFIARNIGIFFGVLLLIFLVTNAILLTLMIRLLNADRAVSMRDTSRVDTAQSAVESPNNLNNIADEPTAVYNYITNDYTYAFMSSKHCISIGNCLYFQGEITPFGKLLTATSSRLICEVSPTEYNVVYRPIPTKKAVPHGTATEK